MQLLFFSLVARFNYSIIVASILAKRCVTFLKAVFDKYFCWWCLVVDFTASLVSQRTSLIVFFVIDCNWLCFRTIWETTQTIFSTCWSLMARQTWTISWHCLTMCFTDKSAARQQTVLMWSIKKWIQLLSQTTTIHDDQHRPVIVAYKVITQTLHSSVIQPTVFTVRMLLLPHQVPTAIKW